MTIKYTDNNKGPKRAVGRATALVEALGDSITEPKAVGAYTEAELLAGLEAFKLARASWGSFWLLYEKPATFRGAYEEGWWTLFKSICRRTSNRIDALAEGEDPLELDDYLIGASTDSYDPDERLHSGDYYGSLAAYRKNKEAKEGAAK